MGSDCTTITDSLGVYVTEVSPAHNVMWAIQVAVVGVWRALRCERVNVTPNVKRSRVTTRGRGPHIVHLLSSVPQLLLTPYAMTKWGMFSQHSWVNFFYTPYCMPSWTNFSPSTFLHAIYWMKSSWNRSSFHLLCNLPKGLGRGGFRTSGVRNSVGPAPYTDSKWADHQWTVCYLVIAKDCRVIA